MLGIKIYIFTVQLDSLQTLCPKPFKYFAAAPPVAPPAVWEQVWSRINPSSQVQPPAGGLSLLPTPSKCQKRRRENPLQYLFSLYLYLYLCTRTHTQGTTSPGVSGAAPSFASSFWQTQRFGGQEGPQPNVSPTKLAELPSSSCPQGQGMALCPQGWLGTNPPHRAQPVVPRVCLETWVKCK